MRRVIIEFEAPEKEQEKIVAMNLIEASCGMLGEANCTVRMAEQQLVATGAIQIPEIKKA